MMEYVFLSVVLHQIVLDDSMTAEVVDAIIVALVQGLAFVVEFASMVSVSMSNVMRIVIARRGVSVGVNSVYYRAPVNQMTNAHQTSVASKGTVNHFRDVEEIGTVQMMRFVRMVGVLL
jgi:hypothetical protein